MQLDREKENSADMEKDEKDKVQYFNFNVPFLDNSSHNRLNDAYGFGGARHNLFSVKISFRYIKRSIFFFPDIENEYAHNL